jgi:hypothetical protein
LWLLYHCHLDKLALLLQLLLLWRELQLLYMLRLQHLLLLLGYALCIPRHAVGL